MLFYENKIGNFKVYNSTKKLIGQQFSNIQLQPNQLKL